MNNLKKNIKNKHKKHEHKRILSSKIHISVMLYHTKGKA